MVEELEKKFKEIYKSKPEHIYRIPSRINLIGEHCDYNGGIVLPCAIDRYLYMAVSKRKDRILNFKSLNIDDGKDIQLSLDDLKYNKEYGWRNYMLGCFDFLDIQNIAPDEGLDILIASTIPIGAGLSSSAALLVGTFYLIRSVYDYSYTDMTIAGWAVMVERNYCHVKCGAMDQMAIALAKENKIVGIDCRKSEVFWFDIDLGDYSFVVLNTNKERSLIDSEFNTRTEECAELEERLSHAYDMVNLCDLKYDDLGVIQSILKDDEKGFRRVRHVISEQRRVQDFYQALKIHDIYRMGVILNASHKSLKEDYEVSCEELDVICELANKHGAEGARMIGAGFGGCAIALIKKDKITQFKNRVESDYYMRTGRMCDIFEVKIVGGPEEIKKQG